MQLPMVNLQRLVTADVMTDLTAIACTEGLGDIISSLSQHNSEGKH